MITDTEFFRNDMKKVIRDNTEMVPFAISKPGGDPKFRVEVTDVRMATQLEDDLQTTYDRFEPSKSSLVQVRVFYFVTLLFFFNLGESGIISSCDM